MAELPGKKSSKSSSQAAAMGSRGLRHEIQMLAARLFADWGGDARINALPNLV
jgi:hypothetical protein